MPQTEHIYICDTATDPQTHGFVSISSHKVTTIECAL